MGWVPQSIFLEIAILKEENMVKLTFLVYIIALTAM